MKNIAGWLIIVFCSLILLIFIVALIALTPDILKGEGVNMSAKDILSTSIGLFVIISLTILGLYVGIKKIRKEKEDEVIEYTNALDISLKGKIAYKDYRNLILGLTFKKPFYIIVLGIFILFILQFIISSEMRESLPSSPYFLLFLILWIIFGLFFTLRQIKRNFDTNKVFHEELNYKLDNNSVNIKGSAVEATTQWDRFYKIKETKAFILLYQGEGIATLLEKKWFTENEKVEFLKFLKSLKIKKELITK